VNSPPRHSKFERRLVSKPNQRAFYVRQELTVDPNLASIE
jgi:hypothetical protein